MKKNYLFMLHFDEHCENDLNDKKKKKNGCKKQNSVKHLTLLIQ